MTSSALMDPAKIPRLKKDDSVPPMLLGIDFEWSLIFLCDILASKIQERVLPSSRVAIFKGARVFRLLYYP